MAAMVEASIMCGDFDDGINAVLFDLRKAFDQLDTSGAMISGLARE